MFNAPHFQDPDKAREYLERLRWAGEPSCPHCGTVGGHYATKRAGVWRCHAKECRKDFSVTTKSVMESSHTKLHIWLQAFALMTASKKGMSAHQLHRSLGVTYKTARFLAHRIHEAVAAETHRAVRLYGMLGGVSYPDNQLNFLFGPTLPPRKPPPEDHPNPGHTPG